MTSIGVFRMCERRGPGGLGDGNPLVGSRGFPRYGVCQTVTLLLTMAWTAVIYWWFAFYRSRLRTSALVVSPSVSPVVFGTIHLFPVDSLASFKRFESRLKTHMFATYLQPGEIFLVLYKSSLTYLLTYLRFAMSKHFDFADLPVCITFKPTLDFYFISFFVIFNISKVKNIESLWTHSLCSLKCPVGLFKQNY